VLETSLAVILLGEILSTVRNELWEERFRMIVDKNSFDPIASYHASAYEKEEYPEPEEERGGTALNYFDLSSRFTNDKMLDLGWRPSEVEVLHSLNLRTSMLYFMSMLVRPFMVKGHKTCTKHQCLAMQIDEKCYQIKHNADHCDCRYVSVAIHEVEALLKDKKIPVLEVIDTGDDAQPIAIRVQESIAHDYVAISHVWSHDLGNPTTNSLPQSQLRRLRDLPT